MRNLFELLKRRPSGGRKEISSLLRRMDRLWRNVSRRTQMFLQLFSSIEQPTRRHHRR
jgi:hypothetical protein